MARFLFVLILGAMLLAGCGQGAPEIDQSVNGLSWPPQQGILRTASDEQVTVNGAEFSLSDGATTVQAEALKFGPTGGELTWAIYSLQGFGPDVELGSVNAEFVQVDSGFGDNTQLWLALSNYAQESWEWFALDPDAPDFGISDFSNYVSPTGVAHVAAVLDGNGYARLDSLTFERIGAGANTPVPQNLQATPIPGEVQLAWDPIQFADGYNLYRATQSDFSNEVKLNVAPLAAPSYDDTSVVKLTDYWYRVTGLRGGESAPSAGVMVTSSDTTLAKPENLVGEVIFENSEVKILLNWDAVLGASSYGLQRATKLDFSDAQTLTPATNSYLDAGLPALNRMYYYRVYAIGIENSPNSDALDIYAPQTDLPAPTNFSINDSETSGTYATFEWDWPQPADPGGYKIYLHDHDDFALDGGVLIITLNNGTLRSHTRFDLQPGKQYFARIAATATGLIGRMSDAIEFTTDSAWVFNQQETIGAGGTPMALTSGGGDLTLAYIDSGAVLVSRRNAGTWDHGESIDLDTTMDAYLDIKYGGGQHLVSARQGLTDDCWVSVGNPGDTWTATRVHGDGSSGLGHPVSGHNVRAAADDTEYAVIHIHWAADEGDQNQARLHTRPSGGGPWTDTVIYNPAVTFLDMLLLRANGDLHALNHDVVEGNLFYGVQSGGFAWEQVNLMNGDDIANGIDLHSFDGGLITPAFFLGSGPDPAVAYAYRNEGSGWERDTIATVIGTPVQSDMATRGDEAIMTWLASGPNRWFYAYYDGTVWGASTLTTGPVAIGDACRVAEMGGDFFIVFRDAGGIYHCAKGVPPAG